MLCHYWLLEEEKELIFKKRVNWIQRYPPEKESLVLLLLGYGVYLLFCLDLLLFQVKSWEGVSWYPPDGWVTEVLYESLFWTQYATWGGPSMCRYFFPKLFPTIIVWVNWGLVGGYGAGVWHRQVGWQLQTSQNDSFDPRKILNWGLFGLHILFLSVGVLLYQLQAFRVAQRGVFILPLQMWVVYMICSGILFLFGGWIGRYEKKTGWSFLRLIVLLLVGLVFLNILSLVTLIPFICNPS